ncbi:MAG TPA: GNAT family N-acetyltransferase [Solirubrobacteraceae bacterium]|jgi:predicted dehydrogenase/GNAT superfamily N-acetyltransferase|nr:GNAT family N-acetyltransferase [Solirubrobacteraceae bacterium]
MRIAVLGQGSIGRRHAEIALALGHELTVYDPDPSATPPPGALAAASVGECLEGADAAIVASPSSAHVAHARAAIELGVPVLVEKPLALDAAHAAELHFLAEARDTMLSVAMNLREHPGVRALSALVSDGAVGSILRASAWCGSWLPDWRPASDYRKSYSARGELGGGVLLDVAVHELDYLLWIAGPARSASALARHVSELETDVEDVALIALELAAGGVAEIGVDYLDRSYTRGCRIVGSEGTLHWSWEEQLLTHRDASGTTHRRVIPSDVAPTYRAQLERFLQAAREGAPAPVSAASAQQVLSVIDAARSSSRYGRRVALAPPVRLRAADAQDAELILAWRNDPETRRWSRDSREIEPEEHARWLRRVLADSSTRLWMAECEGQPIASVRIGPEARGLASKTESPASETEGSAGPDGQAIERASLDPRTEGTGEVHIMVAPQARGRGLGAAVLVEAAARALAEPGIGGLHAHVKPHNEASLRAFVKAGFRVTGTEEDGLSRLERLPVREPPTSS